MVLDAGGGEESLGEGEGDEGFVDGVAAGGEEDSTREGLGVEGSL